MKIIYLIKGNSAYKFWNQFANPKTRFFQKKILKSQFFYCGWVIFYTQVELQIYLSNIFSWIVALEYLLELF